MKRYNLHYVIFRICCTAAILNIPIYLSGCFSSSSSLTNPISIIRTESSRLQSMPEWQISTIDADLYLYRVSKGLPQINDSGSYLTGLTQCGVGRTASAIATTRQLLVGLKDVEILKKERVMFNGEAVLFSRIKAKLDEHLLDIICLSFRHENCVNDLIIWNNKNTSNSLVEYLSSMEPEKLAAFIADFPEILTR